MRVVARLLCAILGLLACIWVFSAAWGAFSPVVVVHYSEHATGRVSVFFNDNDDTRKLGMSPGQTLRFRTAMFPKPGMWILITFPGHSADHIELTQPFSRVDVFVGDGAKVERTEIRDRFLARLFSGNPDRTSTYLTPAPHTIAQ